METKKPECYKYGLQCAFSFNRLVGEHWLNYSQVRIVTMQRWFFLEDRKKPKIKPIKKMTTKTEEQSKAELISQQWLFTVNVPELTAQEKVFITGSIPELGMWDHTKVVLLKQEQETQTWSQSITIPNTCDVYYRYGICTVIEESNDIVMRRWETSFKPRVIKETMLHSTTTDVFGDVECDGQQKVTRGWLTTQTLLQFKFTNNPLKLKGRMTAKNMYIKVTPVKLTFGGEKEPHVDESSQSIDTSEVEMPSGTSVEVATLDNDTSLCTLHPQEQFGRQYKPNDIMLINVTVPDIKVLAYLIDLFAYSSHAASEDPPCHIGYTYILPNMFQPSEGSLELPVTCNVKHRPLGTINLQYLIVRPMTPNLCDLEVSYSKHWNPGWTGLEVGHRGLGASFKTKGYVQILTSCLNKSY